LILRKQNRRQVRGSSSLFFKNNPMTLKVGLIGCGGIAQHHIKGYQANQFSIAGITDPNAEALGAASALLPEAKAFTSYLELLDSGVVNAVSICTPPFTHREIALAALQRGIHVLCEKPLAQSLEEARQIAQAAQQSSACFMVAFRHRFLPAIVKLKEIITSGQIGEPVLFTNVFCGPAFSMKDRWFARKSLSGGGTLMDTSVHSIDLFRFLIGEVVAQQALFHRCQPGIEVEDISILSLKAVGGALGTASASWVAGEGVAMIEVVGQKGKVSFDYRGTPEVHLKVAGKDPEVIPVATSLGFGEEIARFAESIQTGKTVACGAEDGLRALEIIEACYASAGF
jgi:predicted dehydrogenase